MNIKVYYVSPKGCAQSVAMAIAKECRSAQEPLMPAYPPENVALMFIGCEYECGLGQFFHQGFC